MTAAGIMERFTYPSRVDGWPIQAYRWPAEARCGVLVIAHGMAEHALRYQRFAQALNGAGFDVWAMDHRAHGRTSGPQGLGDFGDGGWDALVDDIDTLVDIAGAANPGRPLSLFGHSMGAAAAQQYAPGGSRKLTALVLSGSTLRRPGSAVPAYNQAFEPARTAYDWLSRDPAEVDAYVADPLCGFEGQAAGSGAGKGFDRNDGRRVDREILRRIRPDLPVLLVAGDADPVNDGLRGIEFLAARWHEAGVRRIDRRIYPGGRHEMLNEINRDQVTRDVIHWLQDRHRPHRDPTLCGEQNP